AIAVWNGVIVDGHNRYQICDLHNIPFQTVEKQFADRNQAKKWIILNQLGRRNLSDFDRGQLALRLEENFRTKARENQEATQYKAAAGNNTEAVDLSVAPKMAEPKAPINTREEVAKIAGLSHGTIDKIKAIKEKATVELKEAVSEGIVSINTAAAIAELKPEEQNEILQLPEKEIVRKAKEIREKQGRIPAKVNVSGDAGNVAGAGKIFTKEEKEIRHEMLRVACELVRWSKEQSNESLGNLMWQAIADLTRIRNRISPETVTITRPGRA